MSLLRTSSLSLLCLLALFTACAGGGSPAVGQLAQAPGRPVAAPEGVESHTLGYILFDPETGTVLEEHNRRLPLIPASTTKVLTLGLALHELGGDYRFETTLGYTGSRKTGKLILSGGEDPELSVRDLLKLLRHLKKTVNEEWAGPFYYSGEPLFRMDRIDAAMQEEAPYNPAIGSLSLDSNIYYVRWKKTPRGEEAYLIPSLPGTSLTILSDRPDEKDHRQILYAGRHEAWLLRKPKGPEGLRAVPTKDAGLFTARVFRELALTRGLTLPEPQATTSRPQNVIAVHESRPLRTIAEEILASSDNAKTELVLLHLMKKMAGRPLDLHRAAHAMQQRYQALMPEMNWKGFRLYNGSGLTSKNRITAEQLLACLLFADSIPGGIEPMLPIGGWTRGLMGRLNRPGETFRVAAKTGGIFYSVSLTGFVYPRSGRRLAFAILISDLNKRRQYEASTDKMSRKTRNEAMQWVLHHRDMIDQIVSSWIRQY